MQVKDRVLEALEANRGTYFSGEALAQKLAVSRSAVWKAIQQLRESGYPIEAASKRGYCLAKDSAILSAQSIAQYLTVPQLRLEVEQLVTEYVDFYNYERISLKNGLTPVEIRSKTA